GADIPIEERSPTEVTHVNGKAITPPGVKVWNPAFDVTPHDLVTAIVTENGVARPPYTQSLAKMVRGSVGEGPARAPSVERKSRRSRS
ncbi:MAG: hypothetical protein ACKPBU_11595, partial [Alphaproteobacteria bacterium]